MKKTLKAGVSQNRLRKNYSNFEEFEHFSEMYSLSSRLGYASAKNAWAANPMIQYGSNPSDFCRVDSLGRRYQNNDDWGAGNLSNPRFA